MRAPSPLSWIHPVASRAPKEQRVQWLILTALAVLPILYFFSSGRGGMMAGAAVGDIEIALHRPKVILFGDSITERSFDAGGWGAALAHNYSRKVGWHTAPGRHPGRSRRPLAARGAGSARGGQIPRAPGADCALASRKPRC
jgi:hypothetical protein